jgi:hypothetical protein
MAAVESPVIPFGEGRFESRCRDFDRYEN